MISSMETTSKQVLLLYTEQTPNPESLKFVSNKMLFRGIADFKTLESAKEWSELAIALFGLEYVQSVYISNNFVTITKKPDYSWHEIMLPIKDFLKNYIEQGGSVVHEKYSEHIEQQELAANEGKYDEKDIEIVRRIKEMITNYVKPAVEMDGGNIEFKSYHQGVVTVMMQGSCSGCPSSTVTLKSGIEGLLKRMVPEVTEVVAEAC
ncbi:MAG TPA: NifU family protein [Saprospiraceae bacterium]|nr:NifU family protein [Saprospiraceae bacterium]